LHQFTVFEGDTLQQQLDLFWAVDVAPGFLGFLDQLECQTKEGWSRYGVAPMLSAVRYRRRLNRIGRSQMLPLPSVNVVEREQAFHQYPNANLKNAEYSRYAGVLHKAK
jgi:hypothetical protein